MKKLLLLAVLTAMVAAFSVVGAVSADATSSSVSVAASTYFAGSFAGSIHTSDFTVAAYEPNATDTHQFTDGTDYVQIVDYTGATNPGHYIRVNFNSAVWHYSGSDSFGGTVAVSTDATPDNDEMLYRFKAGTGASFAFTVKTGLTCQAAGSIHNLIAVNASAQTLLTSTQQCPGTYKYSLADVKLTVPSNGLAVGSYTIGGTITMTNGQP